MNTLLVQVISWEFLMMWKIWNNFTSKTDITQHTHRAFIVMLTAAAVWLFDATKRNQTKEDVPLYRAQREGVCCLPAKTIWTFPMCSTRGIWRSDHVLVKKERQGSPSSHQHTFQGSFTTKDPPTLTHTHTSMFFVGSVCRPPSLCWGYRKRHLTVAHYLIVLSLPPPLFHSFSPFSLSSSHTLTYRATSPYLN